MISKIAVLSSENSSFVTESPSMLLIERKYSSSSIFFTGSGTTSTIGSGSGSVSGTAYTIGSGSGSGITSTTGSGIVSGVTSITGCGSDSITSTTGSCTGVLFFRGQHMHREIKTKIAPIKIESLILFIIKNITILLAFVK